eukprot:COSAG01_NODE_3885_length_5566_cov_10.185529_3_plen_175_part_00
MPRVVALGSACPAGAAQLLLQDMPELLEAQQCPHVLVSRWGGPEAAAKKLAAVKRWAAARDAATALFLWCDYEAPRLSVDTSLATTAGPSSRQGSNSDRSQVRMRRMATEQLMGGPRRYQLLRHRPDGQFESFASVATMDEAAALHPEYRLRVITIAIGTLGRLRFAYVLRYRY